MARPRLLSDEEEEKEEDWDPSSNVEDVEDGALVFVESSHFHFLEGPPPKPLMLPSSCQPIDGSPF